MFFRRKKQSEQDKALHELTTKIGQLEKILEKMLENGVTHEVTIENFNVHDPVLKELTFRFDKLDVKEVSGALNLGNNFGVKMGENVQSKRLPEKDVKKEDARKSVKKEEKTASHSQWVSNEKGLTWNKDG